MKTVSTLLMSFRKAGLLALVLSISLAASAKKDKWANALLGDTANKPAAQKLLVGNFMAISDSNAAQAEVNYAWKTYVVLRVNEQYASQGKIALPDSFVATIGFNIDYTIPGGSSSSTSQTLSINFNKGRPSDIRKLYLLGSASYIKVTITSINIQYGTTVNTLPYLILEEYMEVQRLYTMSCTNPNLIPTLANTAVSPGSESDEVQVSWSKQPAADEYDLEWTWIDKKALAAGIHNPGTYAGLSNIFKNNGTRVTLAAETYKIPLLYEDSGTLFYRVRPVRYKNSTDDTLPLIREAGAWRQANTNNAGKLEFYGHQRPLNWQASTSFAEEGKRKSVVQYFDGSLKNRQTVTKDNSSGNTVVAETFYDRQGRPAIQVLPAPTLNTIIKYTTRFNTLNGAEYDQNAYDSTLSVTPYCGAKAQPMYAGTVGAGSGAARYYSSFNPDVSRPFNNYIPQSGGYPFTETRYTQDNTGRIAAQGGVGANHQLGSGRESKYYYSTPSQEQLDALFGTEVGYANYYQKTMVRDANGQFSVSYTDITGKTIATALAGDPPTNNLPDTIPSLERLSNFRDSTLTEGLISPLNTYLSGNSIISNSSLLVTKPAVHSFSYKLSGDFLKDTACSNPAKTICYDCLYDLTVTISSDCANQGLAYADGSFPPAGQPLVIKKTNVPLSFPDTACLSDAPSMDTSFNAFLPAGEISISKVLSVSETSMQKYLEVYTQNNTCRSLQDFINQWTDSVQKGSTCVLVCDSCEVLKLGGSGPYVSNYFAKLGRTMQGTDDPYFLEAMAAYERLEKECKEICGGYNDGDSYRDVLLGDVTPGGQYARPNSIYGCDPVHDLNDPATWRADFSVLDGIYTNTEIEYKDENGQPSMVMINGVPRMPQELGSCEFIENFRPSWAEALLPYHPEYYRLLEFEKYRPGHIWGNLFENTLTYNQAVNLGLLSPLGSVGTTYPLALRGASVVDPLFTAQSTPYAGLNSTQLTKFKDSLNNFYFKVPNPNPVGGLISLNLWQFVNYNILCLKPGVVVSSITPAQFNAAIDPANVFGPSLCAADLQAAWDLFRTLYLQKRKTFLNNIILGIAADPLDAIAAPAIPRFINEALAAGLMGQPNPPTVAAADASNAAAMTASATSTCQGYVSYWLSLLEPCGALTQADSIELMSKLISVCQNGFDSGHPFGASTVNPGRTYPLGTPTSFVAVVETWARAKGRYPICNGFLITAPQPYSTPAIVSNKTITEKPDSCTCARLTVVAAEKTTKGYSGTLSGYMSDVYNVDLSQGLLDTLTGKCAGTLDPSCRFLSTPIVVPPVLQCYPPPTCQSCEQVKVLSDTFVVRFGNLPPNAVPADSAGLARQQLYANFMNYSTGFSYSHSEYLSFLAKCNYGAATTYCDSLNIIKNGFKCYYEAFSDSYVNRPNAHACATSPIIYGPHNWSTGGFLFTDAQTRAQIYSGWWNYPSQYDSTHPTGTPSFRSKRDICVSNKFAVEARVMNSKIKPNGTVANSRTVFYGFGSVGVDLGQVVLGNDVTPSIWIRRIMADGSANDTSFTLPGITGIDTFYTVRYEVTPDSIKFMYNGSIIYKYKRQDGKTVTKINNIAAWLENGYRKKIDYLKVYGADFVNPVYAENYTDQNNLAWPNPELLCPIPDCTTEWVNYFNQRTSNNRTISQIADLFTLHCGKYLSPCSNSQLQPMLCGLAATSAVKTTVPDSACSDVAQLGREKGTFAWRYYQDSIRNEFSRLYLAKCLAAAGRETLTVTHKVSEYHYTLYYYDRAGNLVKTVPPAGVKVRYSTGWLDTVKTARSNGTASPQIHGLVTQYRYNSLNQVVAQYTPDAGVSKFWYDRLGRLVLSRNAKQAIAPVKYSYTLYDAIGRIVEVGQKQNTDLVDQLLTRNAVALTAFLNKTNTSTPHTEVTRTVYDVIGPVSGILDTRFSQRAYTLRNRVSYTQYFDQYTYVSNIPDPTTYNIGTYYSYDIHGNVAKLLHDYRTGALAAHGYNRTKLITYSYDLISGKVNRVSYNPGYADQFFHRYAYDAENRLTDVYTTANPLFVGNAVLEDRDAAYQYYKHGPLARFIPGQQQVQGLDYAYTIQGWLKGVNSSAINTSKDMGGDIFLTAVDVFGFSLNYFAGDYAQIKGGNLPFASIPTLPLPSGETVSGGKDLYNGNISSMVVNITKFGNAMLYAYRYDQLNRLVRLDAYSGHNNGTNIITPVAIADYKEKISYDPNGNILTYLRNGTTAGGRQLLMDNLTYQYPKDGTSAITNNRLRYVHDQVATANYATEDIDTQTSLTLSQVQNEKSLEVGTDNYQYDAIGNLVKDVEEGITAIDWTVYGKIKSISKTLTGITTTISYTYDPSGNRIGKAVTTGGITTNTTYIRDAQGNVLAVYQSKSNDANSLVLQEQHLYGSSKLGIYAPGINVSTLNSVAQARMRGGSSYELSNHLGNVLATVSDLKLVVKSGNNVSYFNADVQNATDYYAFGMQMPGRTYTAGTAYRYGFNGKENDNEVKGTGNQIAFEARIYDPRIGRFLSIDPLEKNYPFQSTYVFAANNPIKLIDVLGMGPGDPPTTLYHNTPQGSASTTPDGAPGRKIIQEGFNATKNGNFSSYNWFMTSADQAASGRTGSGMITLEVTGVDVSKAHTITRAQTTAWRLDAMKELGYTDDALKALQKADSKTYGQAMSKINGSLYSKVGAYMDNMKQAAYFLEKDGTYAVSDALANSGNITKAGGSAAAVKSLNGLKWAGRTLMVVAVANDLYEIHNSGYEARTIVKKAGFWAGVWAGGTAAGAGYAATGLDFAGPWGWVGHAGTTLVGGIVGGFAGEAITETVYDYVTRPGVRPGMK